MHCCILFYCLKHSAAIIRLCATTILQSQELFYRNGHTANEIHGLTHGTNHNLPCPLLYPVNWSRSKWHNWSLAFNIFNTIIDKWIDFVCKLLTYKWVQMRSSTSVIKRDLPPFVVQQNAQCQRLHLNWKISRWPINSSVLTLFVSDYSPETCCWTESYCSPSLSRFTGQPKVVTKFPSYRHFPVMSARREAGLAQDTENHIKATWMVGDILHFRPIENLSVMCRQSYPCVCCVWIESNLACKQRNVVQ